MDYHEKAFEYAGETVRQVLTLATGVIALTVTFAKDIIEPGSCALPWMKWGWALFGTSIFFGILTLMAIAGQLNDAAKNNTTPDMYAPNIKIFANCQIWICFIALVVTIRFGVIGLNERQHQPRVPPATASAAPPTTTQPTAVMTTQTAPTTSTQAPVATSTSAVRTTT